MILQLIQEMEAVSAQLWVVVWETIQNWFTGNHAIWWPTHTTIIIISD